MVWTCAPKQRSSTVRAVSGPVFVVVALYLVHKKPAVHVSCRAHVASERRELNTILEVPPMEGILDLSHCQHSSGSNRRGCRVTEDVQLFRDTFPFRQYCRPLYIVVVLNCCTLHYAYEKAFLFCFVAAQLCKKMPSSKYRS